MAFFFCSLTHLRRQTSSPNFSPLFIVPPGPCQKISSTSIHNFLNCVVHKQTNKRMLPKRLGTLREHRHPWLKQIIAAELPIAPCAARDVKLSSGNKVSVHCIALVMKGKPQMFWIIICTTAIMFFAHLPIAEDPDHQNLISSSTCNLHIL